MIYGDVIEGLPEIWRKVDAQRRCRPTTETGLAD